MTYVHEVGFKNLDHSLPQTTIFKNDFFFWTKPIFEKNGVYTPPFWKSAQNSTISKPGFALYPVENKSPK